MAAAARDLRVDGTVLITVAAEQLMSESNEMKSIATEPRSRNMLVTLSLSTIMNACYEVLNAICDGRNITRLTFSICIVPLLSYYIWEA